MKVFSPDFRKAAFHFLCVLFDFQDTLLADFFADQPSPFNRPLTPPSPIRLPEEYAKIRAEKAAKEAAEEAEMKADIKLTEERNKLEKRRRSMKRKRYQKAKQAKKEDVIEPNSKTAPCTSKEGLAKPKPNPPRSNFFKVSWKDESSKK